MKPTLAQVTSWFNDYNNIVFDGKLPRVRISFNNTRRQLGQFYWGYNTGIGIKISLYYDLPEEEYRNTLVHEMCHLYCYERGWQNEHHGPRWKAVAKRASWITGMNIQRVHEGACDWEVAKENRAKAKALKEKRNAPSLMVDLEYESYHFLVKVTKKTLSSCTKSDGTLDTRAKSYKVFISNDKLFKTFQTSRSIRRGYEYKNYEYQNTIAPKLANVTEITDLKKLFRGDYDRYGLA